MPAITGFYGGYLNALSTISGVEEAQNRIAARNQQMQMTAKQDALDDQTRQTLSTAFQAQQRNGDILTKFDLEDQNAQQYRNAGKAVMASDPKTGLALMREGDLALHQNQGRRLEAAKVEMLENDRLASLAGMVETQDQLDEYVKLQASKGRVVPREFQTLTPATKAYLERQAFLLDPASKAAGLLFRTKKLELDEAERQRRAEAEKERQAQAERREANRQTGNSLKEGTRSLTSVAPKSEMAYQSEIDLLAAADKTGLFKKADPGMQREAVQDAHLRARQMLQQNPKLTPEEALAEARQMVLGEFTPAEEWYKTAPKRNRSEGKDARPSSMQVNGVTWTRRADGLYYPEK